MFPMTVTLHTPAQLSAVLAAMDLNKVPDLVVDTKPKTEAKADTKVEAKADPKPTAAKSSDKPAASQPTAKADKVDAQDKKPETTSDAAPELTYKDVQVKVIAAIKAGKRTEVVKLLAAEPYSTDHAEKVPAELWPQLIADLVKLNPEA